MLTEMAETCRQRGLCPCRVKFEAVALENNQGRGAATTSFRMPALLALLASAGYKCGRSTSSNWLAAQQSGVSGCGSDCECQLTQAATKGCRLAAKVTEVTDVISGRA